MKVLKIDYNYSKEKLEEILLSNPKVEFIHYKHKEKLLIGQNIITESRKNKEEKEILFCLANNGFYHYMVREDRQHSSFVHHKTLPVLWKDIVEKKFIYNEDGLVYSLEKPIIKAKKLLVLFSSINGPMYQSSLLRMYAHNFTKIGNFIDKDTQIMRIADIGGITGAYYMNTKYLPDNIRNIQKLISNIKDEVEADKIVLLGASKGGTGAILHGILGNYDFVSVDPILSDHFYLMNYDDSHFIKDIFLKSKEEVFKSVFSHRLKDISDKNQCIITSKNSQQYHYIKSLLLDKYSKNISLFFNVDPKIKSHPDVSPKSLFKTTELVNSCLNDEIIDKKTVEFICK